MPDPAPLEYASRRFRRRLTPATFLALGIIFAGLLLCGSSILRYSLRDRSCSCSRMRCPNNLRQIGLATSMYASENAGVFADSLETLLRTEGLSTEVFICSSGSDSKAPGADIDPTFSQLHAGGHCSYIYVGANLDSKSNPNCILAFESPANHSLEGGNVLYADAHTEWVRLAELVQLVPALEAGQNPPPPPSPLTTSAAKQLYQTVWVPRLSAMQSGDWERKVTHQPPATRPTTRLASSPSPPS